MRSSSVRGLIYSLEFDTKLGAKECLSRLKKRGVDAYVYRTFLHHKEVGGENLVKEYTGWIVSIPEGIEP